MTRITLEDMITPLVEAEVAQMSPDQLIIPAAQLASVAGTPADGQVQGAHYKTFDAGEHELVGQSGFVFPAGWTAYGVELITINPTSDAGDVRWEFRTGLIVDGSAITAPDFTVGATVAAGAHSAPKVQTQVSSRSTAAGTHWWRIGRVGNFAGDTKADDMGLMAVIFKKVS